IGRDGAGKPQFRRIGTAEGLPNADVAGLLNDHRGKIWASTDEGLAVIDPRTFAIRSLHRAEGVAIASYWGGSYAATPEGELLFGGLGGLTLVRPELFKEWSYRPPVVITDISSGGKPATAGPFNSGSSTEPLSIAREANSLAVEFSAFDFTDPLRNRYAYRLDGYDKDWNDTAPSRRLAAYTNLPPGTYTLRLRGSNRDGVWTEKTLDLPIKVSPAWYQTLWFRLLLAVAGVAAVAALVQSRTAYLRRRHRELERQVEVRTTEVRQLEQAERLQRSLYAIADLTGSSLERPEMMREMHNIVGKLMYAENFFIALYDSSRKALRFAYFADVEDKVVYDPVEDFPADDLANSLTVAVIHQGKSLMGSSAEISARLGIPQDPSSGPESEAWLGVPMLSGGEVRGAIVVQCYDKSVRYTEADQALLAYVAEHILTALTRRQAQEELEQRVQLRTRELAQVNRDLLAEVDERKAGERLQSALFRIAELTSTSASMGEFYAAVHAVIGRLLYARNFFVALLVEDGSAFDFPYAADEIDSSDLFQRDQLRNGLTEYVLRSGKPLLATAATCENLVAAGEVEHIGTASVCWLGVPLVLNERVAGVLVVQSYTDGIVYSARDQELLTFVSLHIANALQRRQAQESLKLAYAELQVRIDELRRTQSELIENEKMASLGRLVAGVAHEINTPLGIGVTASSYLQEIFESIGRMQDDAATPELREVLARGRRCVELVLSNLGKADQLVKSFKLVAVDQSSEIRRKVAVRGYLGEVLVSLGPRLKQTPHHVEVECPSDLEIDTFPGALYQIVANLVLNALTHAFDNRTVGCMRITVCRAGSALELTFADDGRGMTEDVRQKVFEPFFTTRRGSGGTGLGLHMVYNLVTQLLRGTIACISSPGRGTRFTIRLPL
ncbi:MAG TPA: ATP-binding protein, partial [Xanthomonadaceae bacterium]|nr:ATP-binding protein [Xanthomonadaceae bacterium]